jgi:hypothetical protein
VICWCSAFRSRASSARRKLVTLSFCPGLGSCFTFVILIFGRRFIWRLASFSFLLSRSEGCGSSAGKGCTAPGRNGRGSLLCI